jgi:hypothetical protein
MVWFPGALFTVTSKRFIGNFFAGVACVACVVIPINLSIDLYGLFRAPNGRKLVVSGEERIAKYLYTYRYIPTNFDGVLLGSSVTDNFDTREISGYRLYNVSINGGNAADLRPLAENLFREHTFKITVLAIHRYLTNDDIKKTDLMTPRQYWSALGSPQLVTAYISRAAASYGIVQSGYDDCGTMIGLDADAETARRNIADAVGQLKKGTAAVGNYHVDRVALADLDRVIKLARKNSDRFIIFYPPIPADILALKSGELSRYTETINLLTEPGDVVVDFNSPQFAWIRENPSNFIDAVHLSKKGAALVLSELSRAVSEPKRNIASADSK